MPAPVRGRADAPAATGRRGGTTAVAGRPSLVDRVGHGPAGPGQGRPTDAARSRAPRHGERRSRRRLARRGPRPRSRPRGSARSSTTRPRRSRRAAEPLTDAVRGSSRSAGSQCGPDPRASGGAAEPRAGRRPSAPATTRERRVLGVGQHQLLVRAPAGRQRRAAAASRRGPARAGRGRRRRARRAASLRPSVGRARAGGHGTAGVADRAGRSSPGDGAPEVRQRQAAAVAPAGIRLIRSRMQPPGRHEQANRTRGDAAASDDRVRHAQQLEARREQDDREHAPDDPARRPARDLGPDVRPRDRADQQRRRDREREAAEQDVPERRPAATSGIAWARSVPTSDDALSRG